jgi:hypothetical protein
VPSLTRGRVCNLLYNCFWALPEQSLLGRSPAELTAIFYCLIRDSPNLEGQVPRIYIPQQQGDQVIPLGTEFPFVASYNSQGYGGGILARLHTSRTNNNVSAGMYTGLKNTWFLSSESPDGLNSSHLSFPFFDIHSNKYVYTLKRITSELCLLQSDSSSLTFFYTFKLLGPTLSPFPHDILYISPMHVHLSSVVWLRNGVL